MLTGLNQSILDWPELVPSSYLSKVVSAHTTDLCSTCNSRSLDGTSRHIC